MLNPATAPEAIVWALDLIDIILVMSVNPGFGGQSFLPSQLPKIERLRRMIDAADHPIALAVDGGVTATTAPDVIAAGADTLIAGTSVFHATDYARAIAGLRGGNERGDPKKLDARGATSHGAPAQPADGAHARRPRPVGPRSLARRPHPRCAIDQGRTGNRRRHPAPQTGRLAQLGGSAVLRAGAHGFTWLRDLRALGTDAARLRARALVSEWIASPPSDPIAHRPDVVGARITAWLGHYDFFAATADDAFRQRLMGRLVADARSLSAALPAEELDARALTALKGLVAAAVALREHSGFLTRALRFLPQEISRQILPDGCHAERSPAAQLSALQDLTEIRALFQTSQTQPPPMLAHAIERMAPALRMMRHGDGGLALFNGSKEETATLVDLVLTQAGRGGRGPSALTEGGFIACRPAAAC